MVVFILEICGSVTELTVNFEKCQFLRNQRYRFHSDFRQMKYVHISSYEKFSRAWRCRKLSDFFNWNFDSRELQMTHVILVLSTLVIRL